MTEQEALEILRSRPFDPYHLDLKALRTIVLKLWDDRENKFIPEKIESVKTETEAKPKKRGKNEHSQSAE